MQSEMLKEEEQAQAMLAAERNFAHECLLRTFNER